MRAERSSRGIGVKGNLSLCTPARQSEDGRRAYFAAAVVQQRADLDAAVEAL
jgi:hypothetical protein